MFINKHKVKWKTFNFSDFQFILSFNLLYRTFVSLHSLLRAKFNTRNVFTPIKTIRNLLMKSRCVDTKWNRELTCSNFTLKFECNQSESKLIADTHLKTIDQQTWNESHCRKSHQFILDAWVTWTFQFAAAGQHFHLGPETETLRIQIFIMERKLLPWWIHICLVKT